MKRKAFWLILLTGLVLITSTVLALEYNLGNVYISSSGSYSAACQKNYPSDPFAAKVYCHQFDQVAFHVRVTDEYRNFVTDSKLLGEQATVALSYYGESFYGWRYRVWTKAFMDQVGTAYGLEFTP